MRETTAAFFSCRRWAAAVVAVFVFLGAGKAFAAGAPRIRDGILDLRNFDMRKENAELRGDWKFRWKKFHVSAATDAPAATIPAPKSWNAFVPAGELPAGHGFGTYSVKILLPEKPGPLAITMNEQGTAVRLYVNGTLAGKRGVVGEHAQAAIPETLPLTVYLPEAEKELYLDVQISNYHYRKGGMWNTLFIGNHQEIRTKVAYLQFIEVFVAGSLLVVALYHLGIFSFYRDSKSALIFAFFCLALFFRLVSTGQRILPQVVPVMPFGVYSRIEYASWFFSIPLGIHYVYNTFRSLSMRWLTPVAYFFGIAFTLSLFFSSALYSYTVIPSNIVLFSLLIAALLNLVRLLPQREPGNKLFLFGALILTLFTLNDILYITEIVRIALLGPFGVLFFILCQAIVLSRRLFIVFRERDEMQKALTANLQTIVSEKTIELTNVRIASEATKQQLANVINNIPGIAYRCAPDNPWNMYFLSNEIENLTGYAAADFLNPQKREFGSIVHPDDRDKVIAAVLDEKNTRFQIAYRLIRADGSEVWVEDRGQRVSDETNTPLWIDGVMIDITERKKIEEEMLAAKDKAEAANEAKSRFLANMSHELRTPLHGTIGISSVLRQTNLTQEQAEYADIIENSSYILLHLINDILDLAKIESGKFTVTQSEFDLKNLVVEAFNIAKAKAHPKALRMKVEFAENLPEILSGDPVRTRQILLNLLGNAVKFTNEGEVSLEVVPGAIAKDSIQVRFIVRDTGVGISQENLELIFEPFQQADQSTTREFGGTGLGLTISRQLAALLGGEITVRSAPGKGSEFTATLSFQLVAAAPARAHEDISANSRPLEKIKGKKILLAEDDPTNQIVAETLLRNAGLHVQTADTGQAVLAALQKYTPDLILMDCMMPELDGYETTRIIRSQEPAHTHVPIVALTANAMADDYEKCRAAGMDDYLTKPFRAEDLGQILLKWLSPSP